MPKPLREQPKIVLGLAAALIAAHAARAFLNEAQIEALFETFAIIPIRYDDAGPAPFRGPMQALAPLFGHVFLHGGWLHVGLNVLVFLQAADLVAGRFEEREPGGLRFLALFFGSGIGAALAYIWLNPSSPLPAVGASGAVCGVFAAYLLSVRRDWRAAARDPQVQRSAFWFLLVNVGLAAAARVSGVLPIAWEAHLGGFIAGAALYPTLVPKSVARPGPWDAQPPT